jgi:hypothetical protein
LIHWISQLTDQQAGALVGEQDLEKLAAEQVIETDKEAATYAKVDADTIAQWLENGLVKTDDGMFLRYNLDVFIQTQGNPTPEQKAQQVESVRELAMKLDGGEGVGAPGGAVNEQLEKLTPANHGPRITAEMMQRGIPWLPRRFGQSERPTRGATPKHGLSVPASITPQFRRHA